MSVTISSIITSINTIIGDTSNDRVSEAQRLEAITEGTAWLLEELGNEHMVETYTLDYLDTINYYKVTGSIPDILTGADLRRETGNYQSFARKSSRELSEEIARQDSEPSWAIERRDGDTYLVVNAEPKNSAMNVSYLDSDTNWVLDTTGSDATNLREDTYEKRYGSGALTFDVDVSQSANNRATIYNPQVELTNLEEVEQVGSAILEVYLPDVTNISSVTLVWGTGASLTPSTKVNYWSATVTTDIEGEAFVDGWNTIKVDWGAATKTGTPDVEDVNYVEIVINYTVSQVDDTHFRVNYLRWAKPEKLVFHYISWNVGQVSSVDITPITAFTATTNVPFFSDRYDNYKFCVAQKAASIIFAGPLRLRQEAIDYDAMAQESLKRYGKNFTSSKTKEVKSFKVLGVNLRKRRR